MVVNDRGEKKLTSRWVAVPVRAQGGNIIGRMWDARPGR